MQERVLNAIQADAHALVHHVLEQGGFVTQPESIQKYAKERKIIEFCLFYSSREREFSKLYCNPSTPARDPIPMQAVVRGDCNGVTANLIIVVARPDALPIGGGKCRL